MDNSKKISIITPTHNRLVFLKDAINCVINQTYQNWEYFIISDGYDKNVRDLVKNTNNSKIKYLHTWRTADEGNTQRNYALQYCSGEFLLGLDDDNLINRLYLEKMVGAFTSDDVGYVICKIDHSEHGILAPKYPFKLKEIDLLNFMARKKYIQEHGGWIRTIESDFDLINFISHVSNGKYVNEILGTHRTDNLKAPAQTYFVKSALQHPRIIAKMTFALFAGVLYRIFFLLYLRRNCVLVHKKISDHFRFTGLNKLLNNLV